MTRDELTAALAQMQNLLGCCTWILRDEDGRELERRITRTPGRESIRIIRTLMHPKKDKEP